METTTAAAACEFERLPEELLVRVISLTSPPDACCAAAVSRAFRAAADSDAVWSGFLPRDLPRFAKGELRRAPPSKKGLFLRLSGQPALLPRKYIRMQLDRVTGGKCFTLAASTLQILRFDRMLWWGLIHQGFNPTQRGKRFSEAVEITTTLKLGIRVKIQRKILSRNTTYAAYMVFKLETYHFWRWGEFMQYEEATISLGAGRESTTRRVCLQGYAMDENGALQRHVLLKSTCGTEPRVVTFAEDVLVARRRADGWMEVELGEFYNEEGDEDGEVSISLRETNGGTVKGGLKVCCIEIRTKLVN